MLSNCMLSCGKCAGKKIPSSCKDDNDDCEKWADGLEVRGISLCCIDEMLAWLTSCVVLFVLVPKQSWVHAEELPPELFCMP
jgi:hypothetical protein